MGQDDVRRERGQFRGVSANSVALASGPADVDPHVAADRPAKLLQPLQERFDAGLTFWIVRGCGQQHADTPHPLARCARAGNGHVAAAPPRPAMKSRRFISAPKDDKTASYRTI